jgi:hypothetical protein
MAAWQDFWLSGWGSGGGSVDFTGSWVQAAASWDASATETFAATATWVQAPATWDAALTESLPATASWVQDAASWSASATEEFVATGAWVQAAASWSAAAGQSVPATASFVQAPASWAASLGESIPATATFVQATASWAATLDLPAAPPLDFTASWAQAAATWSATVDGGSRRKGVPLKPEPPVKITAHALYDNLVTQYGLYEGRKVYFAMRREQKGPFAEGNKYEKDGERAQRQRGTGIPVRPPAVDNRLRDFTSEVAAKWGKPKITR